MHSHLLTHSLNISYGYQFLRAAVWSNVSYAHTKSVISKHEGATSNITGSIKKIESNNTILNHSHLIHQ